MAREVVRFNPEVLPPLNHSVPSARSAVAENRQLDLLRIAKRAGLWALVLVPAGFLLGLASLVPVRPAYRARVLLEFQGVNEEFGKSNTTPVSTYDSNQMNIDTFITLLTSGPYRDRVESRLDSEPPIPNIPPPYPLLERLRAKTIERGKSGAEDSARAIALASGSFDAKSINGTRIIELLATSTNPNVAAKFLNEIAQEFIDDESKSHVEDSRSTGAWLGRQVEDDRARLRAAEDKLTNFRKNSLPVTASEHGSSLAGAKLTELQRGLASIQAELLQKETAYDAIQKADAASLPEMLHNEGLRVTQNKIADLQRELSTLQVTFTPNHERVKRAMAQLNLLQATYDEQASAAIAPLKADLESTRHRQVLLDRAYAKETGLVASETSAFGALDSLRQEVDLRREAYQSLSAQYNGARANNAAPIHPIRIVQPSAPPLDPYAPRPVLNLGFGIVAGMVCAVGIAFLREHGDGSVRSSGAFTSIAHAPELGVVPSVTAGASPRQKALIALGPSNGQPTVIAQWYGANSAFAESFRGVLISLLKHPYKSACPAILVTSPSPRDGKTTSVCHLSMAFAESGRRVLVIDSDLRLPGLHTAFGIPNGQGLSDLLATGEPLTGELLLTFAVKSGYPGVHVLTSGTCRENTVKLLHSPRFLDILETARRCFDILILDSPPILAVADARLMAGMVDGVVLVVRFGRTDQDAAILARDRIASDGVRLLGTILNDFNGSPKVEHYYTGYDQRQS